MKSTHYLLFFFSISLFFTCKEKTPEQPEAEVRTSVEMVTNNGTITLELYNETPLHRDNFLKLINEKAYDSLLFHRVIKDFMIQGGDPESRHAEKDSMLGEGDLGYTVKGEFYPDLFHKKGALATAREDNQDRASSAIQFFIVEGKIYNDSLLDIAESTINKRLARNYVINDSAYKHLWDSLQSSILRKNDETSKIYSDSIDTIAKNYNKFEKYTMPSSQREVYKTIGGTPTLDQNYTVFGEVIQGLDIVEKIAAAKTDKNDRPISDVRILSVKVLK